MIKTVNKSIFSISSWQIWILLLLLLGLAALCISPVTASAATDWYGKGKSLSDAGRYDEALVACNKAIELDPNDAIFWNAKGFVLANLGRYNEALVAYNKAIELNPNVTYAWTGKGAVLGYLGRQEEALVACNKAIELNPNDAVPWRNKANALYYLGRYEEALVVYNKAIELDPNYTYAWTGKGVVLANLGRYEESLVAFNKAIGLDPNNAIAWTGKADTLRKLNRNDEAAAADNHTTLPKKISQSSGVYTPDTLPVTGLDAWFIILIIFCLIGVGGYYLIRSRKQHPPLPVPPRVEYDEKTSNIRSEEVSETNNGFSFWKLPNLTIIYVILFSLLEIYLAFQPPQNFLWLIISIVMGYWCGSYAAKHYAPKINGSQSWAFAIGYTFSLVGYVCYWIYYKHNLKESPSRTASREGRNANKSFLTVLGWIGVILILLLIGSYVILGTGMFTKQTSQTVVYTTPSGGNSLAGYSTYENKSLGFKIDLPKSWTYQINSNSQIEFDNPEKTLMIFVYIADLSGTKYSASSVDEVTDAIIKDSSNKNLQLITNKASTLSGYYAREIVYTNFDTGNENNKFKIVRKLAKDGNKFYDLSFWSPEGNFDIASTVVPTVFNSFTIETTQAVPTKTADTLCGELVYCGYALSGYVTQPIKSDRCTQLGNLRMQNDPNVMACLKNPYEASGQQATEYLKCRQGMGDLETCLKVADKNGMSRNSMKSLWCETNSC